MKRISVAQPLFRGREQEYVLECLESTRISSSGRFIDGLERQLAAFCEIAESITCCNGTAALHLALKSLNVGPGDEIIVPALTYVATANAVAYCGATPVFVDVEQDTGTICPQSFEDAITRRTRGAIAVHLYGHPAEMGAIMRIARQRDLFVVEDACEAIGARYNGRPVGSIGTAGAFSFYGNKIVTCGEGGAVVTGSSDLAAKVRLLRGQGVDPKRTYWHEIVGFNYRMPNLLAAVALAQLEDIEWHRKRREQVFAFYDRQLADLRELIDLPVSRENCRPALWLYVVRLRAGLRTARDDIARRLAVDGIETRPVFYPISALPPYAMNHGDFPVSENWSSRGLCLPTHSALENDDIEFIASRLRLHLTSVFGADTGASARSGGWNMSGNE